MACAGNQAAASLILRILNFRPAEWDEVELVVSVAPVLAVLAPVLLVELLPPL